MSNEPSQSGKPNRSLLATLLELQGLDRVARAGYALRGVADPESVTEHSWHLLFLVWVLAPRVPEVDRQRALELALIHDLAEVRTGDLPRPAAAYYPAGAKATAERSALLDLLAPIGERAAALVDEYEAAESVAARFVRCCDHLQLLVKATAYEGWGAAGLAELWRHPEAFADGGFPAVRQLYEELRAHRQAADREPRRSVIPPP